jgi:hypothetical protein
MERDEILLKEYEICEQDNNSASANNWTVIGIFASISVGSLAAIIFQLVDKPYDTLKWHSFLLVIIVAIMAIVVISFLKAWTGRVSFLLAQNNHRMREIEKILGMQRGINIWAADNWDDLPVTYREQLVSHWELLCFKCERNPKSDNFDSIKNIKCDSSYTNCLMYKKKLAKSKQSELPKGLRPPDTGRKIISYFFDYLSATWGLFSIVALGLMLHKLTLVL